MEDLIKFAILFCLVFWNVVFATPLPRTQDASDGGSERVEHIVIINKKHPSPPRVADVLQRISLHEKHPYVRHVYNNNAFRGFAASLESSCLQSLTNMSDVSIVEPTAKVSLSFATKRSVLPYQTRASAPWGLQRISNTAPVQGNPNAMTFDYSYANAELGCGSDIYIIDTGIYTGSEFFGGRAKMLWSYDDNLNDENGHGTHVSGTAGGYIVGVASNANLFGMKALDAKGDGLTSNVVAAIDQVINSHDARKSSDPTFKGSVMSMSLSAGISTSIDDAISSATQYGVHTCVAAGNDDADACAYSPSNAGGDQGPAIAVGAVDISANRASFSNYGDCVDVYAPGEFVISAWIGDPYAHKTLSGTSMATPHVTGIVAYAMANETLANSPAMMKEWVRTSALLMSNGLLLANNGVSALQDQSGESEDVESVRETIVEDVIVEHGSAGAGKQTLQPSSS